MAPLNFGVLLIPFQTTDVSGPIDILENGSKKLLASMAACGFPVSPELEAQGTDFVFHYVGETLGPVVLTGGFTIVPSTTVDECPPLDYLLVGGPDPASFKLSERFSSFVQRFVATLDDEEGLGKTLFTTCTGAWAIASSGVLNGKKATTNHAFLRLSRQLYPQVDWREEQWVADGKFWTAGGACAGMDMMAHWLTQNHGRDIARVSYTSLDFEPRDINGALVFERQHGVPGRVPFAP